MNDNETSNDFPEVNEAQLALLLLATEAVDARRQNGDFELPVSMETICNFALIRNTDIVQHALSTLNFEEATVEDLLMALTTASMTALVDGFAVASQISQFDGLGTLAKANDEKINSDQVEEETK